MCSPDKIFDTFRDFYRTGRLRSAKLMQTYCWMHHGWRAGEQPDRRATFPVSRSEGIRSWPQGRRSSICAQKHQHWLEHGTPFFHHEIRPAWANPVLSGSPLRGKEIQAGRLLWVSLILAGSDGNFDGGFSVALVFFGLHLSRVDWAHRTVRIFFKVIYYHFFANVIHRNSPLFRTTLHYTPIDQPSWGWTPKTSSTLASLFTGPEPDLEHLGNHCMSDICQRKATQQRRSMNCAEQSRQRGTSWTWYPRELGCRYVRQNFWAYFHHGGPVNY